MNDFGASGKATDFFARSTYREGQKQAIERVEAAFASGYEYVILEAPTGSGKSEIARAFAFQAENAHILTPQKILQDQYRRDFKDMAIMKGRSAYQCRKKGFENESCEMGYCQRIELGEGRYCGGEEDDENCDECGCGREDCDECGWENCGGKSKTIRIYCSCCPYKAALKEAQDSPVTVHNFDSFYYQSLFGTFGQRELLVVDECHNIETKFLNFISFDFDNRLIPELEIQEFDSIDDYDELLGELDEICNEKIGSLEKRKEKKVLDNDELKKLKYFERMRRKLRIYFDSREEEPPVEYVFDFQDKDYYQRIKFRPIFIGSFARKSLFPKGRRTLMMSATILDAKLFCQSIGLKDLEKVEFIRVPSFFPVENRPIRTECIGKMSKDYIKKNLPKMQTKIEEILKRHPDKKGIIQTHSEKIARAIKKNIKNPRLTFNKDSTTPKEMLEIHGKRPGSFIVASGLREGLDLKGDLSEIQIICKTPYPDLGDKRVKRRKELQPGWYEWMTALMFVQSLGRSVRSKEEKVITYILDSCFPYFYIRNKKLIPEYIRQTIDLTAGPRLPIFPEILRDSVD